MKKSVRKWGNSFGVTIQKEEAEVLNLKAGDIVEITIVKVKSGDKK